MKLSKPAILFIYTLVVVLFYSSAQAVDNAAATVNNVQLPKSQLELMVNTFVAQGAKDGDELRKQLTEELIAREAVAQEAIKLRLDKSPEVIAALANAKRDLLVNAFQVDYAAKHPVSDVDVRTLYEQQKQEAGDKEYRVRHVLVRTEVEAKEILTSLEKGTKLEVLARENSLDSSSRATGGDIGWQVPVMLVPSVRETIKKLDKGQTSDPVQSQFGWHVVRVDDVRSFEFPALDNVKSSLQLQLQRQSALRAIGEIRSNAQVK
jgi:peptidyl-prolyl cis-trans isomerase C